MNIDTHPRGAELTFRFSGEIDHHGARNAIGEIGGKIEFFRPHICCIDMKEVTFMDSSGIAVVLCAFNKMRELDGRVQIINTPDQARRVLDAAGLDRLVTIAV